MLSQQDSAHIGKKPAKTKTQKGDLLTQGIKKLLESMTPEKRVERIKDIIADYVAKFEDEPVLSWLKILQNEYETQSAKSEDPWKLLPQKEAGLISFRSYLRELYWELPSIQTIGDPWASYSYNFKGTPVMAFPITRKWMLERIIAEWESDPNQNSISTFRFLIAACNPLSKDFPPRKGESEYELRARGRNLIPAEKKMIWELIKNHTGSTFFPGILETWMSLPLVPHEIQQILAKAWVRNGGWQALPRILKRSDILASIAIENYSSEAVMTLREWIDPLLRFDQQVQRLVTMLRSHSDIPEEVTVIPKYHDIPCTGNLEVWIKADIKGNYSQQDGRAIFNRILDIVIEWNKPTTDGGGRFIAGRRIAPYIRVCGENGPFEKFEFETTLGDA
ncbi:MAG: hypothetical protein U1A23_03845 [Candidatus Sungbacteria bacterium]|nr:hypothetical protein [bacterium]MDZ4286035.1 hypothetical protein [Candidatus Sungbacteria bacterium]